MYTYDLRMITCVIEPIKELIPGEVQFSLSQRSSVTLVLSSCLQFFGLEAKYHGISPFRRWFFYYCIVWAAMLLRCRAQLPHWFQERHNLTVSFLLETQCPYVVFFLTLPIHNCTKLYCLKAQQILGFPVTLVIKVGVTQP